MIQERKRANITHIFHTGPVVLMVRREKGKTEKPDKFPIPDFIVKAADLYYIYVDNLTRTEIATVLEFMFSWIYWQKTYKGLGDRAAAIQLAASFSGSLRSWWEHLGDDFQGIILNPPPGTDYATRRLVEAVYAQFIGSKVEERLMLQEAFNRAEICDINKTTKFLTEMRTLILKLGEENNMAYKTALIHKFPPAIAKVGRDIQTD